MSADADEFLLIFWVPASLFDAFVAAVETAELAGQYYQRKSFFLDFWEHRLQYFDLFFERGILGRVRGFFMVASISRLGRLLRPEDLGLEIWLGRREQLFNLGGCCLENGLLDLVMLLILGDLCWYKDFLNWSYFI